MRQINRLVIHHTATPRYTTVESIRNFHMNKRGWRDIGYHFIIDGNCDLRLGRPVHIQGAHVKHYNSDSIGLAVVGDFRAPMATDQQIRLFRVLEELLRQYPDIEVMTHKELSSTLCPGEFLINLIDDWRR